MLTRHLQAILLKKLAIHYHTILNELSEWPLRVDMKPDIFLDDTYIGAGGILLHTCYVSKLTGSWFNPCRFSSIRIIHPYVYIKEKDMGGNHGTTAIHPALLASSAGRTGLEKLYNGVETVAFLTRKIQILHDSNSIKRQHSRFTKHL